MFKEPVHIYTNPAVFGEVVQIDGKDVNAIFDREYAPDNGFGFSIVNAEPRLTLADKDVPTDIQAACITVRGADYGVAAVDFDGTGVSVLQLKVKADDPPPY